MIAPIIKDRLYKAGVADMEHPWHVNYGTVTVAYEIKTASVGLLDEDKGWPNETWLFKAVAYVLHALWLEEKIHPAGPMGREPIYVVCHGGFSRSVVVGCLAAALHTGESFWHFVDVVRETDPEALHHQDLLPVARRVFPEIFAKEDR